MEHNLEDWKEISSFVDGNLILDCSPLKWYNNDGNKLSPSELIDLGYWGVISPVIPSEYNPEINRLEEVELKDCKKDEDRKVIIRSYKLVALFDSEIAQIQREMRNNLLESTDKLVYPDIWENLSEERRQKIKSYRKDLRDVPQQEGFPRKINWPLMVEIFSEEEISLSGSVPISPIEDP